MNLNDSTQSSEIKKRKLKLLLMKEQLWEETKAERFIPNRAQKPFMESKARIRAFVAANKLGKSAAGAVLAWRYAKQGGKVLRIIGGLGFERGVRDVIIPEMRKWIPKTRIIAEKLNSQGVVIRMTVKGDNGENSVFSFMSGEQEDQSFEGDIIDFAWIDEPVKKGIYTATLRGLMMTNGPMILTLTPLKEPWIYNDIWSSTDKDIECFPGELEDALKENGGHLDRASMESFVSKLTADEIDARVHGKFKHQR